MNRDYSWECIPKLHGKWVRNSKIHMEEQVEVARMATPKQPQICSECKLNQSKYNCPGCFVRSCSLPCIKSHKLRTGCTGNKRRCDFVPLSDFNDNLLISDYNMLEDVKRITDAARRTRAKLGTYTGPQYWLPFHLKGLRNAAANRKTKLLFLPSGMSKREKNKSRYDHKKKLIQWTIEWRFHSTDVILLDHGVHEDRNLLSVVENHLQPSPWSNKLRQFTEEQLDTLKFLVRKNPKGSKSPFRELDIMAPIREQFSNLVILEYPVIHVFLSTHSYDFEVVKDVTHKPEPKDCADIDAPIPNGILLKEEEIEGDSTCADPQALGVMKNVSPACHQDGEPLMKSSDDPLLERVAAGSSSCSSLIKADKLIDFDDLEFDFDQSLRETFSNLIAEVNPNDYLDLEGMFSEENDAFSELIAGVKTDEYFDSEYMFTNEIEGEVRPVVEVEVEEGEIWE